MVTATSTTSTNTSTAPERSLNQRMDALARANQIRIQRAQLKRDLKAGRRSIHSLLLDPPEYVETAKVFDMLLAVPEVRAREGQQDPRRTAGSPRARRSAGSPSASARELVSLLRRR